jgi:hypothetical protein
LLLLPLVVPVALSMLLLPPPLLLIMCCGAVAIKSM